MLQPCPSGVFGWLQEGSGRPVGLAKYRFFVVFRIEADKDLKVPEQVIFGAKILSLVWIEQQPRSVLEQCGLNWSRVAPQHSKAIVIHSQRGAWDIALQCFHQGLCHTLSGTLRR